MISENYKKQYLSLKRRINTVRVKLIYSHIDESSTIFLNTINNLAKELDISYSDEAYLDEIEERIAVYENGFSLIRI